MTLSSEPPALAIAAALDASDAEERRQATASLSLLSPNEALPLLLRALGDADWRVRKEATFAARGLGPDAALIDTLVRVLAPGDNVGLRNAAVDVLASLGHAATGTVAKALPGLDADGRKLAVEILGRSRDQAALEPLQTSLRDEDSNVRHATIEAIAGLGATCPESVEAILVAALDNHDGFVRMTALEGLNALGVSVPWRRLAPLMDDPTLRAAAVSAAALSNSDEAPLSVARALASARGSAFTQALTALARLAEGPSAVHVAAALRAQGDDLGARLVRVATGDVGSSATPTCEPSGGFEGAAAGFDQQRRMALLLAAVARAPGAVDAAIAALAEEPLAETAQRALSTLGVVALPGILAQLSGSKPARSAVSPGGADWRAALVDTLTAIAQGATSEADSARVPWPRVFSALRTAVRDEDRRVATSALMALSRLGLDDDLELVAGLTQSAALHVAYAAESALAALSVRFPEAARAFARNASERSELQLPSAVIIGALAAREGDAGSAATRAPSASEDLAFLAHAVTAGDARTRRAAVAAVGELGGAAAFEILGFALADEEREVQLAAARALGRLSAQWVSGPTSEPPSAGPTTRPGVADVLELVGRSGDADLVAALVRALGETMGAESESAQPATNTLLRALAPLAADPTSPIAIAAVDALGRAPSDAPGRDEALVRATEHADPAVVRAAILKLGSSPAGPEPIARCLDHPSPEVRLLAAEVLGEFGQRPSTSAVLPGNEGATVRARLSLRATIEPERDVREAIEGALAALQRLSGGSGSS